MKKLILLAAFAVTTSIASAQVSFGVQLGANIAFGKRTTVDNSGLPTAFSNDPKVGVIGGFLAEIPLGSTLAFRPELNFIQKGSKTNSTFSIYESNSKITLNYIEMPLNVVYKLNVGSGNFFFGLGPTLAFGISGKIKTTDPNDPTNNENTTVKFDGKKDADLSATDDKAHLKAFDFGANIIAGYKLGMGVFFKLGYTYNFVELDPNHSDTDKPSYKNRGFNVCVGYMIGGSKSSKKKD